jgi:hypothetical protein
LPDAQPAAARFELDVVLPTFNEAGNVANARIADKFWFF